MAYYTVKVSELYSIYELVEADSEAEALAIAEKEYEEGRIVIDSLGEKDDVVFSIAG